MNGGEWLALAIGTAAGVFSGCGVGGGTLLLLYLTAVAAVEQRVAAGVNLLYFLCSTPAALITHLRHRLIDGHTFFVGALAGMVAAGGAAWAASVLETDWLRRGFGVLLLYIGVKSLFAKDRDASSKKLTAKK